MPVTLRTYQHPEDYQHISAFLIEHYQPANRDGNWLEPELEYMHGHPYLQAQHLEKIGIWEEDGKIVTAALYESRLGEAFFQFKPGFRFLREEMLDYAEGHLATPDGHLHAYVHDTDAEFSALVKMRGYVHEPREDRPMARLAIPKPFPKISLPEGYRLLSLADEPDWAKMHQVMWRGFNHEGEPELSPENLAMRRDMFDTVTARRDLKIIVAAPNGDFISICGMFYQPDGRYGYVEPVATDPDYRRMGLGKAAVLEGIRRCGELGAVEAFVGSDQPFYLSLGFEVQYVTQCWRKQVS
ncbi:MAG: GNAT family N-acetyltransferase [Chloroflexota bacterium]|nr:GNAT family N-acetyltransferase [Chloroflexota bacterium]